MGGGICECVMSFERAERGRGKDGGGKRRRRRKRRRRVVLVDQGVGGNTER